MNVFDQGGSTGDNGGCGGDGVGQLKKGPWTAAEDAVLAEYVRKHGEGNWNAVQRNTGLARCGKSCRLRWANHLRPNLKKGAFSAEEERLIVELHAQLGNKWARMAAQLPGRTDNEIKNYWNTRVKRRHRQGLPLYPPEIQSPQHGGNHHQRQHHQVHHPYHYHQQQQQQQTSQSPASTPTSSFTFYTSPTAAAAHHHFSSCPTTPNCLSPTTPSPLSPSSALHSPHQHPTLPTLALFDSTATNTSSFSPFNVQRPPPILQNPLPLRFKRFHADSSSTATTTSPTNFNTNYNNNFNTSTYQSSSFSLPLSPFLRSQTSPTSLSTPPFSSEPVPFGYSNTPPPSILRSQFENDYNSTTTTTTNYLSTSPVFALKPELPSSQMFSHHFAVDNDGDNDQKLSFSGGGSGLLEDLLDESNNHMMNSMEDKRDFSGFNNQWSTDSTSLNLSPGLNPKEEETVAEHQINTTTTTTLFNAFNPSLQLPAEWYLNDTGEASNGHSSVLTDDNIGLELQQIASMFRSLDDSSTQHAPGTTPGSRSLQNLPGP